MDLFGGQIHGPPLKRSARKKILQLMNHKDVYIRMYVPTTLTLADGEKYSLKIPGNICKKHLDEGCTCT